MYGDPDVLRRRVDQLREQGADIRSLADQLVSQTDRMSWSGRAADALRERIRQRATDLRECADAHEGAADALALHTHEVDRLTDAIAQTERRATAVLGDARTADEDRRLGSFTAPPSGHRDWLSVELPGL